MESRFVCFSYERITCIIKFKNLFLELQTFLSQNVASNNHKTEIYSKRNVENLAVELSSWRHDNVTLQIMAKICFSFWM